MAKPFVEPKLLHRWSWACQECHREETETRYYGTDEWPGPPEGWVWRDLGGGWLCRECQPQLTLKLGEGS